MKYSYQCMTYYKANMSKINNHLEFNYSGPTGLLNFPLKFILKFSYDELFSSPKMFHPDLMNNTKLKFFTINSACKLKIFSKSIKNNKPFIIIRTCGFDKFGCPVKFVFKSNEVPHGGDIELNVEQLGPILHAKDKVVNLRAISQNPHV